MFVWIWQKWRERESVICQTVFVISGRVQMLASRDASTLWRPVEIRFMMASAFREREYLLCGTVTAAFVQVVVLVPLLKKKSCDVIQNYRNDVTCVCVSGLHVSFYGRSSAEEERMWFENTRNDVTLCVCCILIYDIISHLFTLFPALLTSVCFALRWSSFK